MHIKMSSDAGYIRQLGKLFAKSVASGTPVHWPHGLRMEHQKLRRELERMGQTFIIRVPGNIECGMGMVERRDGHCFIFDSALCNRQRPLSVMLWFLNSFLP